MKRKQINGILMKKILFFLGIFFTSFSSLLAQKEIDADADYNFWDRIYVGGGGGFSAGSNFTSINVSPTVGYMFTNRFSSGIGIIYQFINYKNIDLKTHNYGGSVFSRFNVTPQFFVHGEYEVLNYETFSLVGGEIRTTRDTSPALFLGGGYFQPFGSRGGVSITLLYNLIYEQDNSPYPRPYVVRVGFSF